MLGQVPWPNQVSLIKSSTIKQLSDLEANLTAAWTSRIISKIRQGRQRRSLAVVVHRSSLFNVFLFDAVSGEVWVKTSATCRRCRHRRYIREQTPVFGETWKCNSWVLSLTCLYKYKATQIAPLLNIKLASRRQGASKSALLTFPRNFTHGLSSWINELTKIFFTSYSELIHIAVIITWNLLFWTLWWCRHISKVKGFVSNVTAAREGTHGLKQINEEPPWRRRWPTRLPSLVWMLINIPSEVSCWQTFNWIKSGNFHEHGHARVLTNTNTRAWRSTVRCVFVCHQTD